MAQGHGKHMHQSRRHQLDCQVSFPVESRHVLSDCLHVTQKVIVNQNSTINDKVPKESPETLKYSGLEAKHDNGLTLPYSTNHQSWRVSRRKLAVKTSAKRVIDVVLLQKSKHTSPNKVDLRQKQESHGYPQSGGKNISQLSISRVAVALTSTNKPTSAPVPGPSPRPPQRIQVIDERFTASPECKKKPSRKNSFTIRGLSIKCDKQKHDHGHYKKAEQLRKGEPLEEHPSERYSSRAEKENAEHSSSNTFMINSVPAEKISIPDVSSAHRFFRLPLARRSGVKANFSKLKSALPIRVEIKVKDGAGGVRSKTSTGHYPKDAVTLFQRCTKSARFIRQPTTAQTTSQSSHNCHVLHDIDCKNMSRRLEEIIYNNNLPKFRESLSSFIVEDRRKIVDYKETSGSPNIFFRACSLSKIPFVEHMLAECNPNMELMGPFIIRDEDSQHNMVTPFWHAAATGNLHLLRILKEAGGNIDACSDMGSSAILAACFMSHVNVVRYLLSNKINVHLVNVKGLTCLMSAVHNVDLVRLLVLNGAELNRADLRGNTAMHYAAEDGRLTVVRILLELGGNALQTNNEGYTVIQTAAKHRQQEVMEFLIQSSLSLKAEDIIHVYELFASMTILLDYEFDAGYTYFHKATALRNMNKSSILWKRRPKPSELGKLENVREFNKLEELLQMVGNTDQLTMQALLVCERQNGSVHDNFLHLLLFSGATFADRMDFKTAANLWKLSYELKYKKYVGGIASCTDPFNPHLIKNVHSVVKLLYQWKREDSAGFEIIDDNDHSLIYHKVPETTMREILLLLCDHCIFANRFLHNANSTVRENHHTSFSLLLRSVLCVLLIYSNSYSRWQRQDIVWKRLQPLVIAPFRDKTGHTFLHLSVMPDTLQLLELDSIGVFMDWPSPALVDILLLLGADPKTADDSGSTPLHLIAANHNQGLSSASAILESLVAKGAHHDQVNARGLTACDLLQAGQLKRSILRHVSLKCLAARTVVKHQITYVDEIPSTLYSFVELHRNKYA